MLKKPKTKTLTDSPYFGWEAKYEKLRTPPIIALVLIANIALIVGTKLVEPDLSKTLGNFYVIVTPCLFALLTIFLAVKSPLTGAKPCISLHYLLDCGQ